ncbi:hypothetical protein Taro_041187, partial [Colocasia esculenta]|nr:hypothetical protein [Colocasia esculenta]
LPVKLNMARYKCYVVWVGHRPGVYYTWSECYKQVNGYPGARYKGFVTIEEGNMAFRRIIMRPTSSANDTVPFQAPSVVHETQPREVEERVVYWDVLNPLAVWFKGRALTIRSDLTCLFREWLAL